MSKVITFSRKFPSHHFKAGQPTYFVEKFLTSQRATVHFKPNEPTHFYTDSRDILDLNKHIPYHIVSAFVSEIGNYSDKFQPKNHTIRAGHRFKAGDMFSPRVWGTDINPKSGLSGPYHSKQIIIAPDIEIKQVWNIQIEPYGNFRTSYINDKNVHQDVMELVAMNDGLTISDLYSWFNKPFDGQIICWNDDVQYFV